MGMKFTKVAVDAFEKFTFNAGIMARTFNPATAEVGDIIAATSGGITFATNPTYTDYGEDVDNVPANTKQLLRITAYDPVISGTRLTIDANDIAELIGGADVSAATEGAGGTTEGTANAAGVQKITPRAKLKDTDFKDVWFIVDYSDVNEGSSAGFMAVHVKNALNRTGFQVQTGKNAKGQETFEYHGHYDITDENQTPPFDVYIKKGTE